MKRTQIYLDEEQDRLLRERAREAGVTKSELIRRALSAFLGKKPSRAEMQEVLDRTFGAIPKLTVPPRDEWDRGYG